MNDFEVLPVGTAKRIEDLEFELAIFRKAESEVTDAIADKAARELLEVEKLKAVNAKSLRALKLADALLAGSNMNVRVVKMKVVDAIKEAEAL